MIRAIAVFQGKIHGTVRFTETENHRVIIDIDLQGLKRNAKHGFHVHECGDMTMGCESMCAHFNPYEETHGSPTMKKRHVGDLGNIVTDSKGCAKYRVMDHMIKLRGMKSNIIGRGLVIHENEDDCGMGDNNESLVNGNSGKRIACAIIGYAQK
jgi:Cu-Zn family superoxide dismutase